MPTADEYRAAARDLTQVAVLADYYAAIVTTAPIAPTFGTTAVAAHAELGIEDAIAELERARIGAYDLAEMCERRAAICSEFHDIVNSWWDANNRGDHSAPYPEAPHSWVEP